MDADALAVESTPDPYVGEDGYLAPLGHSSYNLVASLVVKSGAGICYGLIVFNNNAAAQFVQVFDASALPADGASPETVVTVPGSGNGSIDYGPRGRAFTRGIVVCNSSTAATKTIGAADCYFDVQYV